MASIPASAENEVGKGAADVARSLWYYGIDMLVFSLFFIGYFLLRGVPTDRVELSTNNAMLLVDFERSLGVFWEVGWQKAVIGNDRLIDLANFTYMQLHMPLLIVLGFLFFHFDTRKHRVIRNTILLSAFVAVPIYILFPVTPPRLLADAGQDLGFVDTIPGAARAKAGAISNWYAAMPSYHFGWIALAMWGVGWCWKSWLIRAVAVAFAALMWWSIVVTGNHYFVDMVAGALVVGFCFLAVLRFEQWAERNPEKVARFTFRVGPLRLPF